MLITTMFENIGQMTENEADQDIIRMEKQFPDTKWRKDYSDFMLVTNESENEMSNPTKRSEGNVFVTCTPKQ